MDSSCARNSTNVRPVESSSESAADARPAPPRSQAARSADAAAPWLTPGWSLLAVRNAMRLLCRISPAVASRVFDRIWFTPPRARPRPQMLERLASGEAMQLRVHGRRIAAWSWGNGPAVLLLHGWGGSAGQMYAFVEPLLAAGLRVVAFDAPGHGASAPSRLGGRRVSFLEFADALRVVAAASGPVAGLVAHSGGCTAASLALRDGWRPPERIAFVAPFAHPARAIAPFARAIGVDAATVALFRERVERRFGRPWSDFDIPGLPPSSGLPPLLLAHDRDDAEVPFSASQAVAASWPGARLLATEGLGHRRLLRDPPVVAGIADFIAGAPWTGASPVPADARDELDRYFQADGVPETSCRWP